MQRLRRVIHEALNPDTDGGLSPGHGRNLRPIRPEAAGEVLRIPLSSLLEGPRLERMDLSRVERPGPLDRVAVALRDVGRALDGHPTAGHLQALWDELLAHRLYDVVHDAGETLPLGGDATTHHRAVFRPVDESLLANLEEAAGGSPAAPGGLPPDAQTTTRRGATVNQRMLDIMTRDPDSVRWTLGKWAERLECTRQAVNDTPAWKRIMIARKMTQAEKVSRAKPAR
jgi:hypothetical protein